MKPIVRSSLIAALFTLGGCSAEFAARFYGNLKDELGSATEGQACADGSALAALITDCPMAGVCFTAACDEHDLCYAFCERSRRECDLRFYTAMTGICHAGFPLDDARLRGCLYLAFAYYGFVEQYGADSYPCDAEGPGPPQFGACCSAGAVSICSDQEVTQCSAGGLFFAGQSCADLEAILGGCPAPPNDDCVNAIEVCSGPAPSREAGRCVGEAVSPHGDRVCTIASQDCLSGESCLPHTGDAFICTAFGDNRLAGRDGPDFGVECGFDEPDRFQADVWFRYEAPCSGTMSVTMCRGTDYDATLAVYGPGEDGSCTCPDKAAVTLLACDDDGCGGFQTGSIVSVPGVEAGACHLIRVGGWSGDFSDTGAARGFSQLTIGMLCD